MKGAMQEWCGVTRWLISTNLDELDSLLTTAKMRMSPALTT
jgi:hypothetical protein